jgi:osmotically-inducible protein OsmY
MANHPTTPPAGAPQPDNPARCGHGGESGRETSWSGPSSSTYGEAGSPGQPEPGPQRPDDRINDEVCKRLTEAPAIDAGDIHVTVDDGSVTLSGTVPDPSDKRLSEEQVQQTSGVRDIRNQLRVRKQD